MAKEIELKLTLPPHTIKALLAHPLLLSVASVRNHLKNTYFDTPDLSLKQARVVLRHRQIGKRWYQTVKSASPISSGLAIRDEWESAINPGSFDFSQIGDTSLRQYLERCQAQLKPVFITNFTRITWSVRPQSGTLIEIALDRGRIESQERHARICEVELELMQGEPSSLFALAKTLQQSVLLHPAAASKAERGFSLLLNQPAPPVKAMAPDLHTELSPMPAFRIITLSCLTQLQGNEEGVMADDRNPEYLHQMRVALRRLRSALQLFRPVLPTGFLERWDPVWRDLTRLFGQSRNWDMFTLQLLPQMTAAYPEEADILRLAKAAKRQRSDAHKAIQAALAAAPYSRLLIDFSAELYSPPFAETGNALQAPSLSNFAALSLTQLAQQAGGWAEKFEHLDEAERHRMRLAFKALRYAVEFFTQLLPTQPRQTYLRQLEQLQDTLGTLNDLAVAKNMATSIPGVKKHGPTVNWLTTRSDTLLRALPEQLHQFMAINLPWL